MKRQRFAEACVGVLIGMFAAQSAVGQWNPPNPVVSFEKKGNALDVQQKEGVLRIEVDAPDVLHVTYGPLHTTAPERGSEHVVVKTEWPAAEFDVTETDKVVTLTTAKLKVEIERESGAIQYASADVFPGPARIPLRSPISCRPAQPSR